MRWLWTDPNDPSRTVALDLDYWTGRKQLAVGGSPQPIRKQLGLRWSHELSLGGAPARVEVALRYLVVPEATLVVDGVRVEPREAPPPLPAWVWVFVVANAAILVVSRGGLIPGALAGIGAAACVGFARTRRPIGVRLALCGAATTTAWGALALLLGAAT